MTKKLGLYFILILTLTLAACGGGAGASAAISDYDSFVAALETSGAEVEEGGTVSQPFLSVSGRILIVNGVDLQVFEYESEAAAEADAELISPDGSSTATTMITWIDTPHFFRAGALIVLYVGDDTATLDLLQSLLGPQFAGG